MGLSVGIGSDDVVDGLSVGIVTGGNAVVGLGLTQRLAVSAVTSSSSFRQINNQENTI